MYSRPKDKEEKKNERKSVEFSSSNLKNRRVYSQKSASQKKETTHNSGNDRYFNEFFEQFQSNSKTTDKVFKPYHHNQPKEMMNRT